MNNSAGRLKVSLSKTQTLKKKLFEKTLEKQKIVVFVNSFCFIFLKNLKQRKDFPEKKKWLQDTRLEMQKQKNIVSFLRRVQKQSTFSFLFFLVLSAKKVTKCRDSFLAGGIDEKTVKFCETVKW